jgi:F0F1-type ATP synthase membrane subunit b/b'
MEAPVRARLKDLRTQSDQRVADARAKLDSEKQKLDAQLRSVTGGLVGLP